MVGRVICVTAVYGEVVAHTVLAGLVAVAFSAETTLIELGWPGPELDVPPMT
jgi:hypothetical protein